MGRSVPWDVLIVGRFKSWTFSDGTFLEWDVSRAGPFVCAPFVVSVCQILCFPVCSLSLSPRPPVCLLICLFQSFKQNNVQNVIIGSK